MASKEEMANELCLSEEFFGEVKQRAPMKT